jgi:hypothetical protein
MFCPDCGGDLDVVPVGEPCRACGGERRVAHVGLEPVSARTSVAELRTIVGQAMAEVAAMPPDVARDVVASLIGASGAICGQGNIAGTLTAEPVQDGAQSHDADSASITASATFGASFDATYAPPATSALRRLAADPVIGPILLGAIGSALGNLASDAVKAALQHILALATAGQLWTATPTGVATPSPIPPTAQVQPVTTLAAPPPSADVCLPEKPKHDGEPTEAAAPPKPGGKPTR